MDQETLQQLYASAAVTAVQVNARQAAQYPTGASEFDGDVDAGHMDVDRKRSHNSMPKGWGRGGDSMQGSGETACRNQTGFIGVRQRKWGMYAAEIRDGDKRRWEEH